MNASHSKAQGSSRLSPQNKGNADLSDICFSYDASMANSTPPPSPTPTATQTEGVPAKSDDRASGLTLNTRTSSPEAASPKSPASGFTNRSFFRSKGAELHALETQFKSIYPKGTITATRSQLTFDNGEGASFSRTRYRGPLAWVGMHGASAAVGWALYGLYVGNPPMGLLTFAGVCAAGWLCTTRPSAEYKFASRAIENCTGTKADLWEHTKATMEAAWLVTTSSASWSAQFSLNPFVIGVPENNLKTQVIKPLFTALSYLEGPENRKSGAIGTLDKQNLYDQAIGKASKNWKEYEGAFQRKYEAQELIFRSLGALSGLYGGISLFA